MANAEVVRASGFEARPGQTRRDHGALYAGDYPSALAWARAARRVNPRQVSGHTARWVATQLAWALAENGDLAGGEAVLTEVLDLYRPAGERSWEAMQLESLARIQLTTGRRAEAGPNIGEALRIASEIGNRLRLADCLGTAAVWAANRNPEAAAVLWGASHALSRPGLARATPSRPNSLGREMTPPTPRSATPPATASDPTPDPMFPIIAPRQSAWLRYRTWKC